MALSAKRVAGVCPVQQPSVMNLRDETQSRRRLSCCSRWFGGLFSWCDDIRPIYLLSSKTNLTWTKLYSMSECLHSSCIAWTIEYIELCCDLWVPDCCSLYISTCLKCLCINSTVLCKLAVKNYGKKGFSRKATVISLSVTLPFQMHLIITKNWLKRQPDMGCVSHSLYLNWID